MAESNFNTEQVVQAKPLATGAPARRLDAIDLLTARHSQVLGIMNMILTDLGDAAHLSKYQIEAALWGARTLLEQAQEATRSL